MTEYPEVPQISWNEILSFIHLRFQSYRQQKSAHVQWDDCGKLLWDLALKNRKIEEFINKIDIV